MKNFVILVLIIMAGTLAKAQDQKTSLDCFTNPPDFEKLSYDELSVKVDVEADTINMEFKKTCPEYISNLVNQIQSEKLSDDKKILAIYFLGELRPTNSLSIETLINYIDLKADPLAHINKNRIDVKRWGLYPAEEALIKVGEPAVNLISNHLDNEVNDLRRQLMCEVLLQVEGGEAAKDLVKRKIDGCTNSTAQTNLVKALKQLEIVKGAVLEK